jgi:hypothetical protein
MLFNGKQSNDKNETHFSTLRYHVAVLYNAKLHRLVTNLNHIQDIKKKKSSKFGTSCEVTNEAIKNSDAPSWNQTGGLDVFLLCLVLSDVTGLLTIIKEDSLLDVVKRDGLEQIRSNEFLQNFATAP